MKTLTTQEATATYYSKLESRLGYRFVMKKSQHFGYYDANHTNEPAAQRNYHEKLAKLLELKPGMTVLDAGCGQGVVACHLASVEKVHVTGITITPIEVVKASRLAKQEHVAETTAFLLADYASPPFPPESFDRIYTTETLSHAPDLKKVVRALMKLLKPGGKLVFVEYEFDFKTFTKDEMAAAEFVKNYAAIHGIYQFNRGNFTSLLKKLKLKDVKETDWTSGVMPSLARIRRLAMPMAKIVKLLGLERRFVNTTAAAMYATAVEKGKFKYKVYSASK